MHVIIIFSRRVEVEFYSKKVKTQYISIILSFYENEIS